MKTKLTRLFLYVLLIIGTCDYASAQVTIGLGEAPEKAALLQVKDYIPKNGEAVTPGGITADQGGILLPRVELTKRKELFPFFSTEYATNSNTEYSIEKLKHKGLTVYNINTITEEDLKEGFYIWNGEEWNQMQESPTKAKAQVNCSRIKVNGTYYAGIALNPNSNTISIKLNVTKKGIYEFLGRSGNGYNFQASGTFDDENSEYTVILEGIGTPYTPTSSGTKDKIELFLNGEPLMCSEFSSTGETAPAYAEVEVLSPIVTYSIDCGGITINGDYMVRQNTEASHYAIVPVDVQYGDPSNNPIRIETESVNGVRFICQTILDANTTNELKFQAVGTPLKAGIFNYKFTTTGANIVTCSFNVEVKTTLGSFDDPAKSCYAIYQEGDMSDGEYWIANGTGNPVKTFCDMTNGGYTLIWSYSEKVCRTGGGIYGSTSSMSIANSNQNLNVSQPRNVVTTVDGTINYSDYRLDKPTMQSANSGEKKYRVRIAYLPTKMDDYWGNYNYFETEGNDNIEGIQAGANQVIKGKLFGLTYIQSGNANNATYGGVTTGGIWSYIPGGGYGDHWDAGFRFNNPSGSGERTTSIMYDFEGKPFKATFDARGFNDLFGSHLEDEMNHAWGKCGASSDDYTFTNSGYDRCSSATLQPHSFNDGQGRYLQWFVK